MGLFSRFLLLIDIAAGIADDVSLCVLRGTQPSQVAAPD
jgi:hypothetical protein